MGIQYELTQDQLNTYNHYSGSPLPRHTSYPAVPYWKASTDQKPLDTLLDVAKSQPVSLYLHVPFCKSLCFYCGCTKEIYDSGRMKHEDPRIQFLSYLSREINGYANYMDRPSLAQIHFGGGTPTFLEPKHLESISKTINEHFKVNPDAEIAVEIDPRITSDQHLDALKSIGCNRVSLGVQDFDENVQKAVNRLQPFSMVKEFVEKCRLRGFSINFDLIYGLPFQNIGSIEKTLDQVISLDPDRIAYYRLALLPDMFKWQKSFVKKDLPSEADALNFNLLAINKLTGAGYSFIGLDHYAKDHDNLYKSWSKGEIRRNFQGMTTGKNLNILGVGPSAIGQFESGFTQNPKSVKDWYGNFNDSAIPVQQIVHLSQDDKIRRSVIEKLYCYGLIDKDNFFQTWKIDFNEYFSDLDSSIAKHINEGILELTDGNQLKLTPVLGRLLVRAAASTFDAYFNSQVSSSSKKITFSRL